MILQLWRTAAWDEHLVNLVNLVNHKIRLSCTVARVSYLIEESGETPKRTWMLIKLLNDGPVTMNDFLNEKTFSMSTPSCITKCEAEMKRQISFLLGVSEVTFCVLFPSASDFCFYSHGARVLTLELSCGVSSDFRPGSGRLSQRTRWANSLGRTIKKASVCGDEN